MLFTYLVLAPGSCEAQRDGDPGCGELQGELAALPLRLLGPLLLADPEPERVDDVSDLSSNDPLLANIPVIYTVLPNRVPKSDFILDHYNFLHSSYYCVKRSKTVTNCYISYMYANRKEDY